MSIKIKNNYDCDGSCNMVENYYYDAKRIIDKIKKNKKYKKVFIIKSKKYDIKMIYEIVEIFEQSKYLNDLVKSEIFDENMVCKTADHDKIINIIDKLEKYKKNNYDKIIIGDEVNYYDIKKVMKIIHNIIINL